MSSVAHDLTDGSASASARESARESASTSARTAAGGGEAVLVEVQLRALCMDGGHMDQHECRSRV